VKLLSFLKKYYFYIFSLSLFLIISVVKFFPNLTSTLVKSNTSVSSESNSILSPAYIFLDISGAVEKPGVYKVSSSSRVGDVIKLAGGFSQNASVLWVSRNINLAKLVEDTQKIYVPYEWETYGDCTCKIDSLVLNIPTIPEVLSSKDDSTSSNEDSAEDSTADDGSGDTSTGVKVNVNTSSIEELDKLSGIGPTYAKKIYDNKPYKDLAELTSKSGIPKSTLEKISTDISF
jgi:competence protein ComEA